MVAAFPHASVAVKITVTAAEQSLDNALKLFVHVTVEQASFATALPWLANQLFSADWFPVPSHCTIRFEACVVIDGAVMSCTFIVCEAVAVFPQASVAVHVRVTE